MPSRMIPIPPSQWVMARHRRRLCGTASISVRIVAPVVVNPDIDSKKASVKLWT